MAALPAACVNNALPGSTVPVPASLVIEEGASCPNQTATSTALALVSQRLSKYSPPVLKDTQDLNSAKLHVPTAFLSMAKCQSLNSCLATLPLERQSDMNPKGLPVVAQGVTYTATYTATTATTTVVYTTVTSSSSSSAVTTSSVTTSKMYSGAKAQSAGLFALVLAALL
ncbi:hypothetical protein BCR33DRAFT_794100 [Rhizoclosmatium globosum]|uniref:Uncharacterized protein n=1 Tax=Rhizoclosmatium globosum TaxID=329046 RepID=A0A1Y2AWJ9_9FUNG|nr:hypothetical protein BCR33DRAFT_794100 [Rhizoclosmatium globosum]|eukprot:ORY26939.1 hypothetical protein BCR33DRAFT_794100 [Rhizoclosmatium globosum]